MKVEVVYLREDGEETTRPTEAELERLAQRYVQALLTAVFAGSRVIVKSGGGLSC